MGAPLRLILPSLDPSVRVTSGSPSGKITSGRNPVTGATVVAYQAGASPGADAIQLGSTTTDHEGRFDLSLNPKPADGATIYFVVTGGDAGGGSNGAISEIAVWG